MTTYKKRSQNMMDEISENLKRTIKKYNEIDTENDLSVIESCENEDSKYNQKEAHKNEETIPPQILIKSVNSSITSPSRKLIKSKNISTFNQKSSKIMDDIENFSNNINKDFKEVEDMIDNMIEKEIKSLYK
jgi:hypothetical protein